MPNYRILPGRFLFLTEGPFYPDRMPLDTDNDLVLIGDATTPAVGQITHLTGRVLGPNGPPVRNAVVEIWQVDRNGIYLHSGSSGRGEIDPNFQGYGRFETGAKGDYYFRTIKPNPYDFRTPHIHVAVNQNGKRMLTTQMYVKGEPRNERDSILWGIADEKARESVLVDFKPVEGSEVGELAAHFEIMIGLTPEDQDADRGRGFRRRRRRR
jgi:protocatechuate 3,4-dioxygenase beta subunit